MYDDERVNNSDSIVPENNNSNSVVSESNNSGAAVLENNNSDSIITENNNLDTVIAENNNSNAVVPENNNSNAVMTENNNSDTIITENNNSDIVISENNNSNAVMTENNNSNTIITENNNSNAVIAENNDSDTIITENNNLDTIIAENNNSNAVIAENNNSDAVMTENNNTNSAVIQNETSNKDNVYENQQYSNAYSAYGYSSYNNIYGNNIVSVRSQSENLQVSQNYGSSLQQSANVPEQVNNRVCYEEVILNNSKTVNKKSRFKIAVGISLGILCLIFVVSLFVDVFSKKTRDGKIDYDIIEEYDSPYSDENENVNEVPVGNAQNISELSANTISVIKNVKPSVVCITSLSESQGFFNFNYESEGSGSGVIFDETDEDIYILTNCHVVEGAKSVSISIEESDLISARLIGKSEKDDLAVIAVSKSDAKKNGVKNVKIAKLGNSENLEVGSPVIAIGNALGEGITATSGIISTTSKEITINNTRLSLIQTDAAINPGNSGGALVNGIGEVIGINTAKIVTTSVEGVGYSIPINNAKPVIESLFNKQNAPFLGVYVRTIDEEISNYYNIPKTGVIVSQIIKNTSAANSDIKEGDIITSFNGKPIFTSEQLSEAVEECKIGDTVMVTIIRNNEKKEISVRLKANPNKGF